MEIYQSYLAALDLSFLQQPQKLPLHKHHITAISEYPQINQVKCACTTHHLHTTTTYSPAAQKVYSEFRTQKV